MKKKKRSNILSDAQIQSKIERMVHQIHENYAKESIVILVGVVGRGFDFAKRLEKLLVKVAPFDIDVLELKLDKDTPLKSPISVNNQNLINNNAVILVDDVLNSGKTLAYAAAYLLQHNPKLLKTAILVNREHHLFPITADFIGLSLATTLQEHIEVEFGSSSGVYLV